MKEKKHISLIILLISFSLFCSYHIYYYFLDKSNNDLVRNYYDTLSINNDEPVISKVNNTKKEEYLGILRIPKISLVEGFYNINSKNNNIGKSVMILKESVMPNIDGSIIYLVAHSGTGYLAYFKNLDKLNIDDIIYLDIDNLSYEYVINDIYEVDRNGLININHNINDNYLILSTCSNNDKQLIISSKLINYR